MAPPKRLRDLKPLSEAGLCEAVILTAPAARWFTTANAITGVGVAVSVNKTERPFPARTSAAAAGKERGKHRVQTESKPGDSALANQAWAGRVSGKPTGLCAGQPRGPGWHAGLPSRRPYNAGR